VPRGRRPCAVWCQSSRLLWRAIDGAQCGVEADNLHQPTDFLSSCQSHAIIQGAPKRLYGQRCICGHTYRNEPFRLLSMPYMHASRGLLQQLPHMLAPSTVHGLWRPRPRRTCGHGSRAMRPPGRTPHQH
jgi:hypothetical protein